MFLFEVAVQFWVQGNEGEDFDFFRRHYSAAKNRSPKQRKFVGPGDRILLRGNLCNALFVWLKQKFRSDDEVGVNCAVFRNESEHRSSDMIREAVAIAWDKWPGQRLFTMIDPKKIRSTNPGYCFLMAGWQRCERVTSRGLLILELLPEWEVTP